jgi:hypothetical protein
MSDQVFEVAVSPAQRWVLLQLSHERDRVVTGQEGRKYRRFARAFALDAPLALLRKKSGVRTEWCNDETPALFEVTAENVEYALKVIDESKLKTSGQEDVIGSLYDALDDCRIRKDGYSRPDGLIPAFDAEKDQIAYTPVDMPEDVGDFIMDAGDAADAGIRARARKMWAALNPDKPDPWAPAPNEGQR